MIAPKAQKFLKGGVGGNLLQKVSRPQYNEYIDFDRRIESE